MSRLDYDQWESNGFQPNNNVTILIVKPNAARSNIAFNKFSNLPNLEVISLSNNQIRTLPESFSNYLNRLTNLTQLYLDHNQLTELPESIGKLKSLELIHAGNNQLMSLPKAIGVLTNLSQLYLDDNQLASSSESIPDSIGNLKNLIELDLGNNNLTTLPESIKKIKDLENIRLNHNQLTILPEWIGILSNLYELHLDNNQLTTLPDSMKKLENLEKLYIENNQFTELPASLNKLRRLVRSVSTRRPFPHPFLQVVQPQVVQTPVVQPPVVQTRVVQPRVSQPRIVQPPPVKADLKYIGSPSKIELFDPILMEPDLKMDTYLKEDPDNMIVISGNSHYALTKDTIRMQMKNTSNIVFECIQTNTLRPTNIVKDVKYLRCNSLGLPGDFIDLKLIGSLLQSKHQIYEIQKTSKKLNSVVSDAVLNHSGSHVSASHCQEGQGGNVYEFIRIFGVNKSSKSRKIRSLSRSKSKKSNTSTYTSKRRKMSNKIKISSSL
jgi:hypothetical protein